MALCTNSWGGWDVENGGGVWAQACLFCSVPKRSRSVQNSFCTSCQGTKWQRPSNPQAMKVMVCFQGPKSHQCLVLEHMKVNTSGLWQRVWGSQPEPPPVILTWQGMRWWMVLKQQGQVTPLCQGIEQEEGETTGGPSSQMCSKLCSGRLLCYPANWYSLLGLQWVSEHSANFKTEKISSLEIWTNLQWNEGPKGI